MSLLRPTALAVLGAVAAVRLPAQSPPAAVARQLARFGKASPASQETALAAVAAAARQSGAPARFVLALADAAATAAGERTQRLPVHRGKQVRAGGERVDAVVPTAERYVFGVGVIEPVEAAAAGGGTAPARADGARHRREIRFEQALLGMAPGADAALAVAEQRLDTDTGGDRFAAFLHAWRNGPESFYEALDRTAGTPDSVFFYDAMLADFAATFAGGGLRTSLQARHDALQDAFLAYRQYRGFREAVAHALVLPPDVPLPARLRRYETAPAGSYSLRQQVVMVGDLLGGDPQQVIDAIVASAPPLPQPIWSAPYDPYPAWNRIFAAHVPRMIELAGHTDAFLAQALRQRREAAAAIAQAALQALAPAVDKPVPGR